MTVEMVNRRLAALSSRQAYEHIVRLAGDLGVRVAGSDPEMAGARYLADAFDRMGVPTTMEGFPHPVWQERETALTLDGAERLAAISVCFGGIGRVTGEVVPVGDPLTEADIAGLDLAGKIALVDGRDVEIDYPDEPQTDLLLNAGVAGLIFLAGAEQLGGLPQAYYNYKRWFGRGTPPSVIISHDDGARLRACAPVQATLWVDADVAWSRSVNVIGELVGREQPDELIVVSAHHDTTATSPGATDNAGGCAIVAELARTFAATGPPKRSIHFIHFGGHETGLHGSETWLRRRLDRIGQIVGNLNYDLQGLLDGASSAIALGDDRWLELVRDACGRSPQPIEVRISPGGVDMMNFATLGVPAVNLMRHGEARYHTPADNLDGTGPAGLEAGLTAGAALLSALADGVEERLDPMPWQRLHLARSYAARWTWGLQ
jgi:Iap family predicted aminopeptidase